VAQKIEAISRWKGRNMSKLFNSDAIEEIRQETEWKEKTHRSGKEPEKVSETLSGLPVESLNTPAHTADIDYLRDLGFPGQKPYVRGVYPTMYRGRT